VSPTRTTVAGLRYLPVCRILDRATLAQAPPDPVTAGGVRMRTFGIGGPLDDAASAAAPIPDLGAALREAHDWATGRGDDAEAMQALVVLLLADDPDGEWRGIADAFRVMAEMRLMNVIGFAFSEPALHALARVTPTLVAVEGTGVPEILDWVTRTADATARLAGRALEAGKQVRAPSLPAGARRVHT